MDGTTTSTNTTVTETVQNTAENSGGDPKQAVNPAKGENAVSTSETAQTEKTFTQKELDDIVRQRVERAKKSMPSAEDMKAFKAWQDSQKTAEQLSAEKITAAESSAAEATRRAEAAEAKCAALTKGVKPDAVEDVIALALGKVTEDTDISAAIDAVIAKYPSFCKSVSEASKGVTTGVNFPNGGNANMSGVEAAFFAKNPDIKI